MTGPWRRRAEMSTDLNRFRRDVWAPRPHCPPHESHLSMVGDPPRCRSAPPRPGCTAASPPRRRSSGPASPPAPSSWGSGPPRSFWSPGRWSPWLRPPPSSPPPRQFGGSGRGPTFSGSSRWARRGEPTRAARPPGCTRPCLGGLVLPGHDAAHSVGPHGGQRRRRAGVAAGSEGNWIQKSQATFPGEATRRKCRWPIDAAGCVTWGRSRTFGLKKSALPPALFSPTLFYIIIDKQLRLLISKVFEKKQIHMRIFAFGEKWRFIFAQSV